MSPLKPGPKPRDPSTHRTVIVRVGLTPDEAARLDAVRGDTDRAVLARDAVLREVKRRERQASRQLVAARDAVTVGPWEQSDTVAFVAYERSHISKDASVYAAYSGAWLGWEAFNVDGTRLASGPETGPEGQRLADAALRAAGYVLGGSTP